MREIKRCVYERFCPASTSCYEFRRDAEIEQARGAIPPSNRADLLKLLKLRRIADFFMVARDQSSHVGNAVERNGVAEGGLPDAPAEQQLSSTTQFGLAPKVRTGEKRLEEAVMKEIKRRKHHSKEYKRKAVELLLTGRTEEELSADLGVSRAALGRWKEDYLLEMSSPPDVKDLSVVELAQKYEQLVKEHEKLKRQQEILKKALGILSETLPTNMP